jgi:hypothetical protein
LAPGEPQKHLAGFEAVPSDEKQGSRKNRALGDGPQAGKNGSDHKIALTGFRDGSGKIKDRPSQGKQEIAFERRHCINPTGDFFNCFGPS